MDLSFRLPDPAAADLLQATELSDADMATLIALLGERQAASATAQVQAAIRGGDAPAEPLLAPVDGRFNAGMAARITEWKQE